MKKVVFFVLVAAMAASVTMAAELKQGLMELEFSANYTDLDESGKTYGANILWGFMLTDTQEVGPLFAYSKIDPDIGPSLDSGSAGAFYRFNFKTGGPVIPFLGAAARYNFGDLGDFFDYSLGVEGGFRAMPAEGASINVALFYDRQFAAESFIDDADSFGLRAGISIFFGQ